MNRILVVDDDKDMREMLREVLEEENFYVETASNGKEAIILQRKNNFPIVITDIIMPEKEGFETIMDLKRYWPDINIIAISGGGFNPAGGYLEIARELGAEQTLQKPFDIEELISMVEIFVRRNSKELIK